MSGLCFDCGKTNHDEALNKIRQQAKQAAIDSGELKVIYKENGEYKYISAQHAAGLPAVEYVSPYK